MGWFAPSELPNPLFVPVENLIKGRHYPKEADHALVAMPFERQIGEASGTATVKTLSAASDVGERRR